MSKVKPNNLFFERKFTQSSKYIDEIESYLLEIRKAWQITDDVYCNMVLIVSELVNNAMEHGNKKQQHSEVTVHIKLIEQGIEIIVKDQGTGIDSIYLKNTKLPNHDTIRGRGLLLVKHCARSVDILEPPNTIRVVL